MLPDILFLSKLPISGHGTTEMRCVQPAHYLRRAGWTISVGCIYRDMPRARRAIVFHRTSTDPMGLRAIRMARARGLRLLYDVDDLLFDTDAAEHLKRFSSASGAENTIVRNRRAMELCDTIICSTTYLRDRAALFHPRVRVMKNGLSERLLDLAAKNTGARPAMVPGVTIGYFSGSRHHDADFALIQPALLRLMKAFPQTRLLLAGKLNFDPAFRAFADRFEFRNFVPYADFMRMPSEVDINLVPLVHRDPFAQARSELKYIEAGVFGVPSVASPTQTYTEAISHGETGLICGDDDWYEALACLVQDLDLRRRLGLAARKDVMENYGPAKRIEGWDGLIRDALYPFGDTPDVSTSWYDGTLQWLDIKRRTVRRWRRKSGKTA